MKKALPATYQGKGWKIRTSSDARGTWSESAVRSEYGPLRSVLLFLPGKELGSIRDPNAALHLRRISAPKLQRELRNLERTYRALGVEVHWISRESFPWEKAARIPANLMYARDLFWVSPHGAVVSRMASPVRAGEEKFASRELARLGVPILGTIAAPATFEGADALWVRPDRVLCGVGNRTNREGYLQLRQLLARQGVKCDRLRMPRGVQHLLGILQLVDRDVALLRTDVAPRSLRSYLRRLGYRVVAVPESDEIRAGQALNLVTVAPRTVVMAAGRPGMRALLRRSGIRIAAEVSIDELLGGAGGIACATGILGRSERR